MTRFVLWNYARNGGADRPRGGLPFETEEGERAVSLNLAEVERRLLEARGLGPSTRSRGKVVRLRSATA